MAAEKPKSTVRARIANKAATTQRFLPIAEIRNDTVLLKNGGMRAVLAVEALNFNLKSETEQQGIIAGYGAFLNTITFPLQIVVRSNRTNIDDYLDQVRTIADKQNNELLKNQTLSYIAFMQKLLDVADIMQKRFYIVVPVDRSLRRRTSLEKFFEWLSPDDTSARASQRSRDFSLGVKELNERLELVETGLGNIGLHTHRMTTHGLLELYYQIFNPRTSQTQKIPKDLDELNLEKTVL